jgi:hypothetical protein
MSFVNFFRDCGIMDVTESACYYVVKFFDADEDGKLTYPEYLQMILPCTNLNMRAEVTQRIAGGCRREDFLSIDVE